MKFCKFVGNSYPHISANFCTFILKFHQMALIFPRVPIVFIVSSFEYWIQTLREQGLGKKAVISSCTLTKGESWALLRKSAVKSTTLAQPFCVNQTVGLGDPPQRLHARFVVLRQFPIGTDRPYRALQQCQLKVIVKSQTVIDCLQLQDTETCDEEKITLFPKCCIFIFWVNRPTQNLTRWKRWVIVAKLTPFHEILR